MRRKSLSHGANMQIIGFCLDLIGDVPCVELSFVGFPAVCGGQHQSRYGC